MKREWSPEELSEKWSLHPNEAQLIASKRGATRLGFALLLKFFQLEGRFPKARNELPATVVDYVAEEVAVTADCYPQYDWHGRAIKYHRAQIRAFSGFRRPTLEDGRKAVGWPVIEGEPAPVGENTPEILRNVVERCLRKKPDERFESTDALLAALEVADSRQPVAAGATSWLAVGGVVLAALAAALFI